ncbi:MAG TPA: hypothetical protein ENJ95_22420 [Bacteroidetes bacterium]|nr:hypothetical protein [Bacteroidota bacterium]
MNWIKIITTAALFSCSFSLFSQIPVSGKLIFGDSSQVHVITTKNGDKFTGRVIAMDQNTLTFQYLNNTLVFPAKDIKLVKIKGQADGPPADIPKSKEAVLQLKEADYNDFFKYRVEQNNGTAMTGQLTKMTDKTIFLRNKKMGEKFFMTDEIRSLSLVGKKLDKQLILKKHQQLLTQNNDIFTGQLIGLKGDSLSFMLNNGSLLKYSLENIQSILLVSTKTYPRRTSPRTWQVCPQQLFFTPSAFMLKHGDREYRTSLILHSLDYGLNDNMTIGTGLLTLIAVNAISGKIKIGASLTDQIHFAVGTRALFYIPSGEFDSGGFLLYYGAMTIGTEENYFNFSAGRGYATDVDGSSPGFSFGGAFRISENWKVFGEYMLIRDKSYYRPSNTNFTSLGMKWQKKHHQVDFGVTAFNEEDYGATPFPIISYAYRF